MVLHNNPSIVERAQRVLNTKGNQTLSDQVEDKIRVVLPLTPVCRVLAYGTCVNQTIQVLYTTPTDKDFYLTSAQLSMIKDATSTSTNSYIEVAVNGVATVLLTIAGFSLTAQNDSVAQSFPNPIKLDRGSQIRIANTTAVANSRAHGTIQGYTEETTSS